jgi:glutamine amidotransferase
MIKPRIGIVSLPNANISSIQFWAKRSGFDYKICSDPDDFHGICGLIIPGIGRFDSAMEYIKNKNLTLSIKEFLQTGKPILGICLGMHVLFEGSSEGQLAGLGFLSGKIENLSQGDSKVPNIGWREVTDSKQALGKFYFMHSFCLKYTDELRDQFCDFQTSECNEKFVAAVRSRNIFGCQYHPEKSYLLGDQLFRRIFLRVKNE